MNPQKKFSAQILRGNLAENASSIVIEMLKDAPFEIRRIFLHMRSDVTQRGMLSRHEC